MTAAELLRKAAAHVTPETWCQRDYWRDADGFVACTAATVCRSCAVGTIRLVAGMPVPYSAAGETAWLAQAVVDIVEVHLEQDLECWNDAPGRTAAEVRALFLEIANELDPDPYGREIGIGSDGLPVVVV